jgi:hypothetical protein
MVVPQGGVRRSRAINSRGSKRRGDAVQTRIRGGCSGGGWPRPSGHESFRREAMRPVAVRSGWTTAVDMPVKHLDMHAAMKTHLSQPTGIGALDGQHGMSLAISSVVADDGAISSATACIDMSEDVPAITGRETGANARPAITRVASSRRMAKLRFINPESHKMTANERLQPLQGVEIPVTVILTARPGLCFAAPVHVYDRAGLPFYYRREAQHRASIILAISSGAAKITAARSPIMPAGMIAGTSFCGPSLLESVIKRRLRSQKARVLPSAVVTR